MNLNEKQEKLAAWLTAAGYPARWWSRGENPERLYLNKYRKDVKVWIDFDDPETLEGPALKVWVQPCGQHPNWYKAQAEQARAYFADAFQIITGQIKTERSADAVKESELDTLTVGQKVRWLVGGQDGESNAERVLSGTIKEIGCRPSHSIGQSEERFVIIEADDGQGDYDLYTWRGCLRYGSGAEIVRKEKK